MIGIKVKKLIYHITLVNLAIFGMPERHLEKPVKNLQMI